MSKKKQQTDFEKFHRQHQLAEERRAAAEESTKFQGLPEEDKLAQLEQEASDLRRKLDNFYSDQDFCFEEPEPKLKDPDPCTTLLIDGFPQVPAQVVPQLWTAFTKTASKLNVSIPPRCTYFMPLDTATNTTKGYAYLEMPSAESASHARRELDGSRLDAEHTFSVVTLQEFEEYESTPESYEPLPKKEFVPRQKKAWLLDEKCRDQYVIRFGNEMVIQFHDVLHSPEICYRRPSVPEGQMIKWSPLGTYLAVFHPQGIILCGGPKFEEMGRFAHLEVSLIAFSHNEKYLLTAHSNPCAKENNRRAVTIWDIQAGKKIHTFYDSGPNAINLGPHGNDAIWPLFKWSHDDRFFALLNTENSGNGISLFEVADLAIASTTKIAIPGLRDFAWSTTNNFISYWVENVVEKRTKEKSKKKEVAEDRPTRVVVEEIPSRKVIRSKNFFNVTDVKMSWHPQGNFLCVKVDRTKGSTKVINLDLFRIREKDVPVDTIEFSDPVRSFSWEPHGLRFAIISGEGTMSNVSFYTMTALKKANPRLIATHEQKTVNQLIWSPRGEYIVLAGLKSLNGIFEFWNVNSNEMLGKGEHHMATDTEWDPSGRYFTTSVSCYLRQHENGYQIWSFTGKLLERHAKERFWQFLWRPRPKSLLTEEDNKWIQKNWSSLYAKYDKQHNDILRAQSEKEHAQRKALWNKFKALQDQFLLEYKSQKESRRMLRGGLDSDDEGGDIEVTKQVTQELVGEPEEVFVS